MVSPFVGPRQTPLTPEEQAYEPYRKLAEQVRNATRAQQELNEELERQQELLNQTEQQANKSSGGIGNLGLSSLRSALGVGILGFTLGGLITTMKNVVGSTGEGSAAFLELSDAWRAVINAFAATVDAPERVRDVTASTYQVADAVNALREAVVALKDGEVYDAIDALLGDRSPSELLRLFIDPREGIRIGSPKTRESIEPLLPSAPSIQSRPTSSVTNNFNAPQYGEAAVRDVVQRETREQQFNRPYQRGGRV